LGEHHVLTWNLMLLMALKSSLESSQLRTSRLLRRCGSLLALGMTDVPCWMPHLTSTCAHTTAHLSAYILPSAAVLQKNIELLGRMLCKTWF
jgi:hypothetical protein